jgi:hypothetical protein
VYGLLGYYQIIHIGINMPEITQSMLGPRSLFPKHPKSPQLYALFVDIRIQRLNMINTMWIILVSISIFVHSIMFESQKQINYNLKERIKEIETFLSEI